MDSCVLKVASLSSGEAFLLSERHMSETRVSIMEEVQIEVISYLLNSRLCSFSPLRNMNLGYTFLWWWISGYKLPWCGHLPYPPLSTKV